MNLELQNCCLRSWQLDHAVSLQRYADNRNIWANLRDIFPHPYTLADAHSFMLDAFLCAKLRDDELVKVPNEPKL